MITSPASIPGSAPAVLRPRARRSRSGFSLVEVTLAVAVASLAIITLLGLLPQGLEMSRKTSLATSNINILEQIIRDVENVRWINMPAAKEKMYFNDQGGDLTKGGADEPVSFVAELDFTQPAGLPKSEVLQPYLKRVIIKIAATADRDFTFTEANRPSYVVHTHLIAKTR